MSNSTSGPITSDQIDKAKQYAAALEKLKTSIDGVNGKLPEFANGMKEGLIALGEKLPEVVTAYKNLNEQNKQLAADGLKPKSILKELASSMLSWNSVVSIGITLLATYGGAIIDWVSDLLKGETRLSAFTKAMKDNAIVADALIQARLKGAQSAQGELTALNSLYRATQTHNKTLDEKKGLIAALKDQWPETFKGLKNEAIATGKAADAYKKLKEQIMAAAYAEAYKNRITVNASRALENDQKVTNERANNLKIIAEQKELEKEAKKNENVPDEFGSGTLYYIEQLNKIKEKRAASDKIIYDLSTDSNLLGKQNDKLGNDVQKLVEKYGTSVLNGGGSHIQQETNIPKPKKNTDPPLEFISDASADIFNNYQQQINATNKHYDGLKKGKKLSSAELEDIEKAHQVALKQITAKFQNEDKQKLEQYQHELAQIAIDSTEDAKQKALLQLQEDQRQKLEKLDDEANDVRTKLNLQEAQLIDAKKRGATEEIKVLIDSIATEQKILTQAANIKLAFETQYQKKVQAIKAGNDPDAKPDQDEDGQSKKEEKLGENIKTAEEKGQHVAALLQQKQLHDLQYGVAITAAKKQGKDTEAIDKEYAKRKADIETQLINAKIHAGDKFINAVLANSKKDSAIYKAAFLAKKATAIADTIISTKQAVLNSLKAYSGIPFIGQALGIAQAAFIAVQGATSIATIAKQKPGFAKGGQFVSDGRGALLPGYSHHDNTNAYLRSGEAVVVSEAMRDPWARNLVSAINVAYGGRDFAATNPTRGYAIGGIFTDGGNSNRYYNQPMNDQKDLANTIAYQMINNFPPIYVDVKDVNNQQNILAQTTNRVNL